MARGHLFVVAAPSGAGKTSLLRRLMERQPRLAFSVSCTTRAPRAHERHGHDYFFVSRDEFLRMIDAGAFVEHADVFGNLYGTTRAQVEDAMSAGRDLILEIDWQGARQVRERLPEAVHVFILPPSRQVLEERLRNRQTDSADAIERRLADSFEEIRHWREFDYVIVNEEFEQALQDLEAVFAGRGEALSSQRPGLAGFVQTLLRPPGA